MADPPTKNRLDRELVARGLAPSRAQARRLVLDGVVRVDGETVRRPAHPVTAQTQLQVEKPLRFVGRGGLKAAAALARWPQVPAICADVGASTGGFTDALLQAGAARVYAIDVGHDQLAPRLRTDPRVVSMERVNARHLERLPEPIERVIIDVSFISARLILPPIRHWLAPGADLLLLLKPQFEGRGHGKRGVIRNPEERATILRQFWNWSETNGWRVADSFLCPIAGERGNREFWLRLTLAVPISQPG
jgi:23S rRNA (cytidine1920-2'-O)/16S rRNA (cytidine1409-2'-O)-methyltransferase